MAFLRLWHHRPYTRLSSCLRPPRRASPPGRSRRRRPPAAPWSSRPSRTTITTTISPRSPREATIRITFCPYTVSAVQFSLLKLNAPPIPLCLLLLGHSAFGGGGGSAPSLSSPGAVTNGGVPGIKYGTLVPNRVFVGGISNTTTEADLHKLFSSFGNVRATKIISDRGGTSKGYGFVTFETEEEARKLQAEVSRAADWEPRQLS